MLSDPQCHSLIWGQDSSLNPCSNGICSLTWKTAFQPLNNSLSLNPCSNGICSLTCRTRYRLRCHSLSLNPCSNGICSLTLLEIELSSIRHGVLILVLMEYALWLQPETNDGKQYLVLILVLMEYALWQRMAEINNCNSQGLNPCSNGICSLTTATVPALTPSTLS